MLEPFNKIELGWPVPRPTGRDEVACNGSPMRCVAEKRQVQLSTALSTPTVKTEPASPVRCLCLCLLSLDPSIDRLLPLLLLLYYYYCYYYDYDDDDDYYYCYCYCYFHFYLLLAVSFVASAK